MQSVRHHTTIRLFCGHSNVGFKSSPDVARQGCWAPACDGGAGLQIHFANSCYVRSGPAFQASFSEVGKLLLSEHSLMVYVQAWTEKKGRRQALKNNSAWSLSCSAQIALSAWSYLKSSPSSFISGSSQSWSLRDPEPPGLYRIWEPRRQTAFSASLPLARTELEFTAISWGVYLGSSVMKSYENCSISPEVAKSLFLLLWVGVLGFLNIYINKIEKCALKGRTVIPWRCYAALKKTFMEFFQTQ